MRPISEDVKQLIEAHHRPGLNHENDERLPTKICTLCRGYLQDIASGKRVEKLPVFDYKLLDYPPERRNGMLFLGILTLTLY